MENSKAIMLITALFFVVGVISYSFTPEVSLSPGKISLFASSSFYLVLFGLWVALALFIIVKNRAKSKKAKEKQEDKELKKKLGVASTKKLESKVQKKIEKKITKKLEKKLTKKLKKRV